MINADMVQSLIIAFRLAKWFDLSDPLTNESGVDFSQLPDPASIVLADASGQTGELHRELIKRNIVGSADYAKDRDDDGELESGEDDDAADQDLADGTDDSHDFAEAEDPEDPESSTEDEQDD